MYSLLWYQIIQKFACINPRKQRKKIAYRSYGSAAINQNVNQSCHLVHQLILFARELGGITWPQEFLYDIPFGLHNSF